MTLTVSIVIPALNEAPLIEESLSRLRRDFPGCELVVADGGSDDGTAELAASYATVIRAARGRARQMNAGARGCGGDVLWFVHADTVVSPDALAQIRACMADPAVAGGGLTLRFDRRSPGLDWLARASTLRARWLHQVYGDQAMFIRRRVFDKVGGFPELPIMEDYEMSRLLRRHGRLAVLPATAIASARRFTEHGTWRMIALMQYLKVLYELGVDPAEIRRRYQETRNT